MIWEGITADVYCKANLQTECWNLPAMARREGGMAPMSEIASFWRGRFSSAQDDIDDYVSAAYIVRYKRNATGNAGWQYSGSSNYTTLEYADAVRTGKMDSTERGEILELMDSLRHGLNQDVTLTTVLDNTLGVRLIVDGLHRATALALMRKENPKEFNQLLVSTYRILMVELRSRWAHVLYPFDFLNLCAREGP